MASLRLYLGNEQEEEKEKISCCNGFPIWFFDSAPAGYHAVARYPFNYICSRKIITMMVLKAKTALDG